MEWKNRMSLKAERKRQQNKEEEEKNRKEREGKNKSERFFLSLYWHSQCWYRCGWKRTFTVTQRTTEQCRLYIFFLSSFAVFHLFSIHSGERREHFHFDRPGVVVLTIEASGEIMHMHTQLRAHTHRQAHARRAPPLALEPLFQTEIRTHSSPFGAHTFAMSDLNSDISYTYAHFSPIIITLVFLFFRSRLSYSALAPSHSRTECCLSANISRERESEPNKSTLSEKGLGFNCEITVKSKWMNRKSEKTGDKWETKSQDADRTKIRMKSFVINVVESKWENVLIIQRFFFFFSNSFSFFHSHSAVKLSFGIRFLNFFPSRISFFSLSWIY